MAVSARIEPIDRDIAVIVRDDLSPQARSAALAGFAQESLVKAEEQNTEALGILPTHRTFVDGQSEAPLRSVRPDGTIVFEFDLLEDLLAWIGEQLVLHSPVKSGRFARSFALFADNQEVTPGAPLPRGAGELVFLNMQPYARKIERGSSPQAPDGVFEAVATLAARRFGNMARIRFSYREPIAAGGFAHRRHGGQSDKRTPAIVITLR